MRGNIAVLVLTGALIVGPASAQDWLTGIARSAAQSAAQSLTNRAVGAVAGATAGPATPSRGSAGPTTAAHNALADMYDADGNWIYRARPGGQQGYDGEPVWRSAAECAALNHLYDVKSAELQAWLISVGYPVSDSEVDGARQAEAAQRIISKFRDLGLMRLRIDQAGSDVESRFDEEMRRQVAVFRAMDWSVGDRPFQTRANRCDGYYNSLSGLRYNMQNGRGDGSRAAPWR
ncbi:hypothetical protein ACIQC9_06915 [Brevundimonas sp. NPDC092305]|uniref:hypothetical protein n=1 Tax=Brevundimonas sp. NPDC092305 TaxID=3363957 RepID=UPI0038254BD1